MLARNMKVRQGLGSRPWIVAAGIAGLLALSACGSSGGGSSASSAASASSSATSASSSATSASSQTAAGALAALAVKQPTPAIPALADKPPAGKTVGLIWCTVPTCLTQVSTLQQGISALGWHMKTFDFDVTQGPQAITAAFSRAIQAKPDYIIFPAVFPEATVQASLEQAKAAGITVAQITGTSWSPSLVLGCLDCNPEAIQTGVVATKVAQAAGADPKIGLITDPTLSAPAYILKGAETQAQAGGGSVTEVSVSLQDTPAQNNATVISYLQSHPDTQYLISALDELTIGLPAALKQAGLAGKVKLILSNGVTSSDLGLLSSGQVTALVLNEVQMSSWRALDLLVRTAAHEQIPASLTSPVGWVQAVTPSTASSLSSELQAPSYEQAFLSAWHAG